MIRVDAQRRGKNRTCRREARRDMRGRERDSDVGEIFRGKETASFAERAKPKKARRRGKYESIARARRSGSSSMEGKVVAERGAVVEWDGLAREGVEEPSARLGDSEVGPGLCGRRSHCAVDTNITLEHESSAR